MQNMTEIRIQNILNHGIDWIERMMTLNDNSWTMHMLQSITKKL